MNALAEMSPLEQAYEQARENFEDIVGYLDSEEASCMTHSELERQLEKKGIERLQRSESRKRAEHFVHDEW